MKKIRLIICVILLLAVVMSGCGSEKSTEDNKTTGTDNISVPEKTEDLNTGEKSENTPSSTPEAEETKLSFEEIEKLAEECSYHVHWYTTEGDYSAGTAFIMDSDRFGEKILVTAFHFLVPDEGEEDFKGKDLPDYVKGGVIKYAKSGANTPATLKNCIVVEDAAPVPAVNKDVAAFTLYNSDSLKTLPLSTHTVKTGDKIYLLANLWDTDDIHENCVYEGKVFSEDGGELIFTMDPKYGTSGASGGPIINEYGEVVAIHMASTQDNSYLFGHSSYSFAEQLNNGTISSVTYPENVSEYVIDDYVENTFDGDEEVEHIYHSNELIADTLFFKIEITGAEISENIGEVAAGEGKKFITVSMDIDTTGYDIEDFELSTDDFAMVWSDSYTLSYVGTEEDGVAGLYIPIKAESVNTAKMAFEIPKDPEYLILYFIDYYYDNDGVMHEVADHYFTIPVTGF